MPYPVDIPGRNTWERREAQLTIPVGATASDELELFIYVPLAIRFPANITAITLAVEERGSPDGVWSRVRDASGVPLAIPVSPGATVTLPADTLLAYTRLRFVGNVAQSGASATFVVLCGAY
jgi:hypothetical protein